MPTKSEIKSENSAIYEVENEEDKIIEKALNIIRSRMKKNDVLFNSPKSVRDYITLKYSNLEHEVFVMFHLDNQHHLIAETELFRGTIDECSVYPREVMKDVFKYNSNKIILVHNHPSGGSEPSRADIQITKKLQNMLAVIDVGILDHLIVGNTITSFAEKGLI